MTRTTTKPAPTPTPVPDGLALTDRLLLALKDGDGHSLADVLERVWPRTFPGESSAATPTGAPRQLGRFQVLRELGRGGGGIVLLALDPVLGREVALKLPLPESLAREELYRRFLREAQVAATLQHPNLVTVHEAGELGPVCYLVEAYCGGGNLAQWLRRQEGPTPPRTAAALVALLAEAVEYTHSQGIVHRDLKPANVLLQPDHAGVSEEIGFIPKITDFGLARRLDASPHDTRTGAVLGTPAYMAPEQAEGRHDDIGRAADIYALGAILYEVLVGHPPFRAASDAETLQQVLHEEPVRPSHLRPDMPRPLEAICLKCLRKEPGQRYPSAGELAHDLQRFLQGESVQARAPGALVRLAAWCRRPEQVQQAGRSLFGFGLLLAAWCVGCLILLGCGQLTAERPAVAVRSLLSWMFLLYLPMSLCGWNVLAGRPRALWPGILFALLLTGCLIVSLLGFALFDLGGITEGPKGDVPINLLLFLVATLVTVACGVGLVAQHSNKRK